LLIAWACAAFTVVTSFIFDFGGNHDLFVASLVFLPLAILVSAVSIGSNIALLHRLAVTRRAQLLGRTTSGRVLRRDHEKHCEAKNGNDIALRQLYLAILLLLIEVRPIAYCRSHGRNIQNVTPRFNLPGGLIGHPLLRDPADVHNTHRPNGACSKQAVLGHRRSLQHDVLASSPEHAEDWRHACDEIAEAASTPWTLEKEEETLRSQTRQSRICRTSPARCAVRQRSHRWR
jgi:hypothetical protein